MWILATERCAVYRVTFLGNFVRCTHVQSILVTGLKTSQTSAPVLPTLLFSRCENSTENSLEAREVTVYILSVNICYKMCVHFDLIVTEKTISVVYGLQFPCCACDCLIVTDSCFYNLECAAQYRITTYNQ